MNGDMDAAAVSRDEKLPTWTDFAGATYHPERCCACRWVAWGEDCGHGESDGIDSPHDHCEMHAVMA